MANLLETLKSVLEQDERFVNEDGELLRNNVIEKANKLDADLLNLLFGNDDLKAKFFVKVGDYTVFDQKTFMYVVSNREFLPDSYTRFKQNVGLATKDGEFLKNKNDIELVFPYKDCVLEGGQTKEEQKRGEIFYNELLADDEVDKLLAPKVLVNAKRYTKDGEESNITLNENDNLIIKGNNLLVISSLLKKYEGKIKLIYIDPPYNTGADSFGYNDKFNHSSWLVFMRNRLEIAKKLLHPNGAIFVQCDDNEQAYLKTLMDEIFDRTNFVNCIAVKMSEATGVKMSHVQTRFPKLKEYLLFYKSYGNFAFEVIDKYETKEWDKENNIYLDNFSFSDRKVIYDVVNKDKITESDVACVNKVLSKIKKISLASKINELKFKNEEEKNEWLFQNSYRIIKTCGSSSLLKLVNRLGVCYEQEVACALSKENVLFFFVTDYNKETRDPRLRVIFADENIWKNPCDFWQDIKTTGAISEEGGVKLLNGKKPEKLLYRIVKMCTKAKDIVLDFHAGTGTTLAVSHKMGRKFIGVEQMDYGENDCIVRMKNVIAGDQTGISKEVNWQGGGSFVYCELAKLNQNYVDKIEAATTNEQLTKLRNEIIKTGFVSCKVKIKDIDNNAEEWEALSVEDKKKFLMELLDKNMLYVNYSDMDDADFAIKEEDKQFTRSFYGEE